VEIHACTDVTGFGLLGHGYEMAHGSGVRLVLEAGNLPLLPGARALAAAGFVTGGCTRNREWLADKVAVEAGLPSDLAEIAWDPQTSGGLLVAVAPSDAARLEDALAAAGVVGARIGRVETRDAGPWVTLR
jgi:selenide,water dikinase